MKASILVAEDERGLRDLLQWELESAGHEVSIAVNGSDAISLLGSEHFDIVISDINMPGATGLEVLAAVKEHSPKTEVLIATGYAELDTAIECIRGGAFDFLQKPFDVNIMLNSIERALEHRRLQTLTVLYTSSQRILADVNPQKLPNVLIELAMGTLNADFVSLALVESDGPYSAITCGDLPATQFSMDSLKEFIEKQETLSKPIILQDQDCNLVGPDESGILFPLIRGQTLSGILTILRSSERPRFSIQDLEIASVLAAQILLAINNQMLVQSIAGAERLAVMGQLAASVVHEITNPVTYMLGEHEFLRELLETWTGVHTQLEAGASPDEIHKVYLKNDGPKLIETLGQSLAAIEEGAQRIGDIVDDMRRLSKSDSMETEVIELNDAIGSALRLTRPIVLSRAKIQSNFCEGSDVRASAGPLSQVFVNLVSNAVQAMNEQDSETNCITIKTERRNNTIVATVTDNGTGIPANVLPRLFEPFYTTKGNDGTGLGLPISRDIVRRYGGTLSARNGPHGAIFSVELPALESDPER